MDSSKKEVYFSATLYIICYGFIFLFAIVWSVGLQEFSLGKFGNFLQFLASIMAISVFIQEKRLEDAEKLLQNILFWFFNKKRFAFLISLPKTYWVWSSSFIKEQRKEYGGGFSCLGLLSYAIIMFSIYTKYPNSPMFAPSDCVNVLLRVKMFEFSAAFENPHCMVWVLLKENPLSNMIVLVAFFFFGISFITSNRVLKAFFLFLSLPILGVYLLYFLFQYSFFVILSVVGGGVAVLVSILALVTILILTFLIVIGLSFVLLTMLPWKIVDVIAKSISLNRKKKTGMISVFTVFLAVIGSLFSFLA